MGEPPELDESFVVEPIRRVRALRELVDGPASRHELETELDVSKATLHRIVKGFVEAGFVQETDDGVVLTGAGREAAAAVERYLDRMALVARLEPLLRGLPPEYDLDIAAFADAEIVTPTPGHPQRSVQRVVDFVESAPSLRATAAVVLPIYVEVLSREITAGMETELVVTPAVIEALEAEYPDRFAEALEAGTLEVLVHNAIEVGLALAPERALIVVPREGGTQVAAVTGRDEAVEWIRSVYEHYRAEAEPFGTGRDPAVS